MSHYRVPGCKRAAAKAKEHIVHGVFSLAIFSFGGPSYAGADLRLFQCDVGGMPIILRSDLNSWLPGAVPKCLDIEHGRLIQLPQHPPEPRPFDWPVSMVSAAPAAFSKSSNSLGGRSVPNAIDTVVARFAEQAGLPTRLVVAVIQAESAFNQYARSSKGARGLMQILPSTARDYGLQDPEDLWSIDENIRVGTAHLARLLKRFGGDVPLGLAAYNAGEGAVIRHGWRIPPYPETERYVRTILNALEKSIDEEVRQ